MFTFSKLKVYKFLNAGILVLLLFSWASCKKSSTAPSSTGVTSFVLLRDTTVVQATSVTNGDSVLITVPGTTNPVGLTPKINLGTGTSISPASGVSQDFTKPVTYTATLSNGSTKIYIVKVITDKLRNIVYAGNSSGKFFALDAVTGKSFWVNSAGDFSYSSPCFANGVIYTGNSNGNMYAYTAALGNLVWSYKTGSVITSSPAVSGGNVYFGSDDHYFYAVNAQNGVLNWKFQTGSNVDSSPLIYNGVVYFGSDDHNFYALDATTGALKWSLNTGYQITLSSPVQLNGLIYFGNASGSFFAVDAVTGQQKWVFNLAGGSFEQARPYILNGIIYVASSYSSVNPGAAGSVYGLDATTGAQVLFALPNVGFSSGPVVADGKIFISGDNGVFYALDITSGNSLWIAQGIYPNGAIPAIKTGVVYVGGGGSNYFYAFDEQTGTLKWKYNYNSTAGSSTSRPYVIDANGN